MCALKELASILQTDGTFTVNALSGVVTLARSLDYDTTQSYSVNIVAEVSNNVLLYKYGMTISSTHTHTYTHTHTQYEGSRFCIYVNRHHVQCFCHCCHSRSRSHLHPDPLLCHSGRRGLLYHSKSHDSSCDCVSSQILGGGMGGREREQEASLNLK